MTLLIGVEAQLLQTHFGSRDGKDDRRLAGAKQLLQLRLLHCIL